MLLSFYLSLQPPSSRRKWLPVIVSSLVVAASALVCCYWCDCTVAICVLFFSSIHTTDILLTADALFPLYEEKMKVGGVVGFCAVVTLQEYRMECWFLFSRYYFTDWVSEKRGIIIPLLARHQTRRTFGSEAKRLSRGMKATTWFRRSPREKKTKKWVHLYTQKKTNYYHRASTKGMKWPFHTRYSEWFDEPPCLRS